MKYITMALPPISIRKTIFFVFFSMAIFAAADSLAQNKISYRTENASNSEGKTLIEFKNRSGKISRTINVSELNPYQATSSGDPNARTAQSVFTQALISDSAKTSVAVTFNKVVYSSDQSRMQELGESTIIVFDNSGVETFRKKMEADNASQPLISANGKYVAVDFGGLIYDDVPKRIGFSIYDVQTKRVIHEVTLKDISGSAVYGNVFVFSVVHTQGQTHYLFDTKSGELFVRDFDVLSSRRIKRFTDSAVILMMLPDAERAESYRETFRKVR